MIVIELKVVVEKFDILMIRKLLRVVFLNIKFLCINIHWNSALDNSFHFLQEPLLRGVGVCVILTYDVYVSFPLLCWFFGVFDLVIIFVLIVFINCCFFNYCYHPISSSESGVWVILVFYLFLWHFSFWIWIRIGIFSLIFLVLTITFSGIIGRLGWSISKLFKVIC